MGGKLWKHCAITALAVGITSFFAFIAVIARPLDPVKRAIGNFSFTDIYYEILKETSLPDTSRVITIVDITDVTNRSDFARLIDSIGQHNPKVMGVDVCFDHVGEDYEGNDALVAAVEQYKDNMVFSMKLLDWENDSTGWTTAIHSFFHEFVDITEGTTNMPRSLYESTKRQVPLNEVYKGKECMSISTQVSNMYADRDVTKGRRGDININFSPMAFHKLLPEEVGTHPELISNRIVLIGALYEDVDTHWTPVGKIAGVELLAYGIQSLLYDKEVKTLPLPLMCLVSLLMIFLVEVLQVWYLEFTGESENLFVKFVIGSGYILGILTFLFTSLFLGVSFLVFAKYNLSINIAWAMSVITFLGTSRSMYSALRKYYEAWRSSRRSKQAQDDRQPNHQTT